MRYILISIFISAVFFVSSCSSIKEKIVLSANDKENKPVPSDKIDTKRAMEHFIQGSIYEQKAEYEKAVIEYQEALLYDQKAGIYYALGKVYNNLGKFALSALNLKKAVELDSNNIDYKLALAQLYRVTRQQDEAIEIYNSILSRDSTNIEILYELAVLHSPTRPRLALEYYDQILKNVGDEWSVLYSMIEIYNRLGEYEKAAELYEKLLFIDPSNVSIKQALAELYLIVKKFEKAEKILSDLLIEFPDDHTSRLLYAQMFVKKNDWEKASDQFKNILANDSIDNEIKIQIAAEYLERSMKDSSVIPFVKSLLHDLEGQSEDWRIPMYLGAIYETEQDTQKAINYFSKVTSLAEWNAEAWIRLGGLYFDNGRYREVINVMGRAYELFPNEFPVNLLLGLSHLQLEDYKYSIPYLTRAKELNPKELTTLSSLGFALGKLERYDEAVSILEAAFQLDDKNLNVISTLGIIYDNAEEFNKCDKLYEYALKIFPDNALLLNNYAYSLAERSIRLEEALQMSKKSLQTDSLNSSYLDTLGWIYFQMGDYLLAEKYVKMAVDQGSTSSEVLEHMGDIYYKLNNKELALEYWNKAFRKDPSNKKLENKINKGKF
jgi:tetratricopeptide (TPR) repeat protein